MICTLIEWYCFQLTQAYSRCFYCNMCAVNCSDDIWETGHFCKLCFNLGLLSNSIGKSCIARGHSNQTFQYSWHRCAEGWLWYAGSIRQFALERPSGPKNNSTPANVQVWVCSDGWVFLGLGWKLLWSLTCSWRIPLAKSSSNAKSAMLSIGSIHRPSGSVGLFISYSNRLINSDKTVVDWSHIGFISVIKWRRCVSITIKCLWCPHQNHSVIMKM